MNRISSTLHQLEILWQGGGHIFPGALGKNLLYSMLWIVWRSGLVRRWVNTKQQQHHPEMPITINLLPKMEASHKFFWLTLVSSKPSAVCAVHVSVCVCRDLGLYYVVVNGVKKNRRHGREMNNLKTATTWMLVSVSSSLWVKVDWYMFRWEETPKLLV